MEPKSKNVKHTHDYTLPKQLSNTKLYTPQPNTDKPLNTLKNPCDINLTASASDETDSMNKFWEILSKNTEKSAVPLLTIRHLENVDDINYARGIKETERNKIQPISISNIFKSQKQDSKQFLFKFESLEYRVVKIKGVVTKIKNSVASKSNIDVDDSTGVIRVIVDNSSDEIKYRFDIKKNLKESFENKTLGSEELKKIAQTPADDFFKDLPKEKEEAFLNTVSLFFGKQTDKKNLAQFPLVSELELADKVTIIGRLLEFDKKRCIYAYSLKRYISDAKYEEFCHQYEKDFCLNISQIIKKTSPKKNNLSSDDDSSDHSSE